MQPLITEIAASRFIISWRRATPICGNVAFPGDAGTAEPSVLHVGVHQLLRDVVEEVPPPVGEGALQEGQGYQTHVVVLEGLEGVGRLQPVVLSCRWRRWCKRLGRVFSSGSSLNLLLILLFPLKVSRLFRVFFVPRVNLQGLASLSRLDPDYFYWVC